MDIVKTNVHFFIILAKNYCTANLNPIRNVTY